MPQAFKGLRRRYEIDHYKPYTRAQRQTMWPKANQYGNLFWSCGACNARKGAKWPSKSQIAAGSHWINLSKDEFSKHFELNFKMELRALTKAGEYTLDQLDLNEPELVKLRQNLASSGFGVVPFVRAEKSISQRLAYIRHLARKFVPDARGK